MIPRLERQSMVPPWKTTSRVIPDNINFLMSAATRTLLRAITRTSQTVSPEGKN